MAFPSSAFAFSPLQDLTRMSTCVMQGVPSQDPSLNHICKDPFSKKVTITGSRDDDPIS
jgi:hypothetical protein